MECGLDVLQDLPFWRCLGYLDGGSLFVLGFLVNHEAQRVVCAHAVELASERRVRKSVAQCTRVPLLLDVLKRMESAGVWETFEDDTFCERGWRRCLPSMARYYSLREGNDSWLALEGGGEMNFTGLTMQLPQSYLPTRISFRYRVAQPGTRRGFCNVYLARQKRVPSRFFRVGDDDVFSFLLPLGEDDGSGPLAQLWLPRNHRVVVFDRPPPNKWRFVSTTLDWDLKARILRFKIEVDGHDATEPVICRLAQHYTGFNHIYLFNWLSDNDGAHPSEIQEDYPKPRADLADLVLETTPDPDFKRLVSASNLGLESILGATPRDDVFDHM